MKQPHAPKNMPLFINVFFEQTFIDSLLCAKYCPRPWDMGRQGRLLYLEADHLLSLNPGMW